MVEDIDYVTGRQSKMAIELPEFEGTYGLMLTACGQVRGKGLGYKAGGESAEVKVARYQTSSGSAFIRGCLRRKEGWHLHIDCGLGSAFEGRDKPKPTHKKAEVMHLVEESLGAQIDVHITAYFDVPLLELPEKGLIRALAAEQKTGDMAVKLTGAAFSLSGTPVNEIRWNRTGKEKEMVRVSVGGERSVVVNENYLCESWKWINEQFLFFVLGGRQSEAT